MEFGILDFLKLIGALGLFIFGMKVMSEGIQKAAGSKMRKILGAMTSNRFFGVLTAFSITALVQSSSATTVMVVSLTNAGLVTLTQSAGLMMGANIGTTVTAWLISIFGFKVSIAAISLPIIAVGIPMLFLRRSKWKFRGEMLIGFALLFMGLAALKDSVPDLQSSPEILAFLSGYTDMGMLSTLLFIGVGTVLTLIVQSSSAAMALTLVMCFNGWIPFENAAAMVLGENIGTTITAELASLATNVHSKRSARIHSIFNLIGVTWMVFALPLYLDMIDSFMQSTGSSSPFESSHSIPIALSYFHTAFNLSNVLLLIGFVPWLVKAVEKMIPVKGEEDEQFHLEYITTGMMGTPELSMFEAKKEVAKFGAMTKKMSGYIKELLQEQDSKKSVKLLSKVKKYEEITDRMELEIGDYLLKVSENELSETTSLRIRSMLSIIGDLERIGDINYQMSKNIERKIDEKAWFTPEQRNNLLEMLELLDEAFDIMIGNLNKAYHRVSTFEANEIETRINKHRDSLRKEHLKSVEQGDYKIESGMIYTDLYSSCEKMGDHIINVTEAITGII